MQPYVLEALPTSLPSDAQGGGGDSTAEEEGQGVGRGLHSSTSQLNMSRSWSLKPYQAPTSQLQPETMFVHGSYHHILQKVLTAQWTGVAHK